MSQECLICFYHVEEQQAKVSCMVCKNIVHYNCFHSWSKKKQTYDKNTLAVCIHCQQPALIVQKKHCVKCCCFPFFK